MLKKKETLVLIVSKKTVSPDLIPPLKVIIPMLQLIGPLKVISSNNVVIQKPIYENLVRYLTSQGPYFQLEHIIKQLLLSSERQKYRICVLGEEDVSWELILSCKRRSVVVDVIGRNAYLPFWTGGIGKPITQKDMLTAFVQDFAIDTDLRKVVGTSKSKNIQFSVNCVCCSKKVTQAFLCSSCLAVYCTESRNKNMTKCMVCEEKFDQKIDAK